ncbi:MAG: hypothetical protein IJI10_02910 [Eubacterium sp.]|nr:hypothetical protein [Eubacterium sp.]
MTEKEIQEAINTIKDVCLALEDAFSQLTPQQLYILAALLEYQKELKPRD